MDATRTARRPLLVIGTSAAIMVAANPTLVSALPSVSSPSASVQSSSPVLSSHAPVLPSPVASSATPPASPSAASQTISPAPTASSSLSPPAQATRPFGAGHPVEISCDKPWAYAFVARGAVDTRPSFPDPFVRVGRLPITIELPSGVYTLIVEGDSVSSGSTVFEVKAMPAHVRVKAGSSSLRELSSYALALGGTSLLAAVALQLSWTANQDSHTKTAFTVPLFIVGGVGLASGVTMFFVSNTRFQTDAFIPEQTKPATFTNPTINLAGSF